MIQVLIAEDQAMVCGALGELMGTERDLEVAGLAGDGVEALSLLDGMKVDVVLADIEMPRMTGLELAAEVRKLKRGVKVIILTTFARPGG